MIEVVVPFTLKESSYLFLWSVKSVALVSWHCRPSGWYHITPCRLEPLDEMLHQQTPLLNLHNRTEEVSPDHSVNNGLKQLCYVCVSSSIDQRRCPGVSLLAFRYDVTLFVCTSCSRLIQVCSCSCSYGILNSASLSSSLSFDFNF